MYNYVRYLPPRVVIVFVLSDSLWRLRGSYNQVSMSIFRPYFASKMDFELPKCPIFVGSLQNPAASNQKGFYTKITQNSSVYLGFDAEVPQKILQVLY